MVRLIALFPVVFFASVLVTADATTADQPTGDQPTGDGPTGDIRGERLANYLSGKKFVGRFTVDGSSNDEPKVEEYEIRHCEKLPQDDLYRLSARIKYGDVDQEVPLEIKILFAGETPVITLDSMWIPGMGTFDARVLIRRDRYCGTWKHNAKGGHLFGKLVPIEAEIAEEKQQSQQSPQ